MESFLGILYTYFAILLVETVVVVEKIQKHRDFVGPILVC